MFCNEIEGTLFSPLPPSLWTDYYNDQEDDFFGNGVMRNYPSSSKGRQLLPSLRHFRSLPQLSADEDDRRDISGDDDDFSDEFESSSRTDEGSSSVLSSPSSSPHRSGQKVKALFHDGCLFAYSPPNKHDRDSSLRSRLRRAKGSLSPRSRRNRNEPLASSPNRFLGQEFSLPKLGKERKGFR
mmetsp:Transcript_589/g.1313  ORF Transcript_589/g.1313 Transcript_589/m.1313 type:complete len:183 (-) Transcript_589:199-747(-)|eukprot:CAMPEP_0116103054 /NCGR_PEP_ID=MMETSP0327-20121206/13681_1 /TAXON_ID=44447 /ORGANISM="Pseudo-nitzschia delicatissima, Strain B596" /LENGTH=182 /DNA_ID=CAMNT_0003595141 /DNA_START=41 /DNA_END=589 /DNA_ORIENTATION=+